MQVVGRAVGVAQYLDFHMPGAAYHPLEESRAVAHRCLGFAAAFAEHFRKLARGEYRPHAAPAAAPGSLQHQGEADLLGDEKRLGRIVGQHFRRRDDGHAGLLGYRARGGLVPQLPHGR